MKAGVEERFDSRIRLRADDEHKARVMAFEGYPQGEVWRLLRLALHEIDCLREDAANTKSESD